MNFTIESQDYEDVYLTHDNEISVTVKNDGVTYDISSATRVTLKVGATTIDSSTSADAFDWGDGDGIIKIALGEETLNTGNYPAALVVYDAVNTNGLYIGTFKVRILSV